jgi:uncharacterized membrane protein YphA (DoxX/SURF4 family)
MGHLRLVLRLLLAAVFLYAAYTKLRVSWLVFAMSVDSYHLLPEWGVLAVARTLPWLELLLGLLLLAGPWLRWTALAASLQLLFFFSVMLLSYSKGMGIDCGCFGVGEALGPWTLARDGTLLACSIALMVSAFVARWRSQASSLPRATVDSK